MRVQIAALLALSVGVAACGGGPQGSGTGTDNSLAAPAESTAANAAGNGGAGAAATASQGEAPLAKAAPAWHEVTIPAGTSLPIVLETEVGSDISRVEQRVEAHLARAVDVNGATALPEGSTVTGVVTDATRSGKVKGQAHVAVRFDSVTPRGEDERYPIQTSSVARTAAATKKEDAVKILAPAAGGALIGRIAGGRKGAAIGAAAGGGAGTAYVMSTRGKEVHLAKGTALTLKLAEPITVRVRSAN